MSNDPREPITLTDTTSGDDGPNLHNQVIHLAYALTADPTQFGTLQQLVIAKVFHMFNEDDETLSLRPSATIERYDEWRFHMNNALNLLEMQGRHAQKPQSLEEKLNATSEPSALVDETGCILHANGEAQRLLGLASGKVLCAAQFEPGVFSALEKTLANIRYGGNTGILSVVRMSKPVKRRRDVNSQRWIKMALTEETRTDGRPVGRLSATETVWTDEGGHAFQKAFNLTEAEFEIAKASVEDIQLADLAEQRERSINTLRSQRRALFQKLSIHSQIELTRLYSGFRYLDAEAKVGGEPIDAMMIARPGGRQVETRFFGPKSGRPIIFFHDGLFGLRLPPIVLRELDQRQLRLICLCRPGFAGTSAVLEGEKSPEATAKDLCVVLDQLEIKRAPVMAYQSGAIAGFAFARAAPERVSGIVSVSGATPLLTKSALNRITPLLRSAYLGVRYIPEIIPFLTRGRIAFTDALAPKEFLKDHVAGSAGDLALLDDPEICDAMVKSRNDAMRQGYHAFMGELSLMASDWTTYLPSHDLPVSFVYGEEDSVNHLDTVDEFGSFFPNATLKLIKKTGRLAFYRSPGIAFDAMDKFEML